MKNNDFLKDFHIGKMIKEIARQKHVSSKKIADSIFRYRKNADKIYKMEDMDTEDMVRISYILKYNLLETLSEKYLSHLPLMGDRSEQETYSIHYVITITKQKVSITTPKDKTVSMAFFRQDSEL